MAAVNFKDEVLVRIYAITAIVVLPVAALLVWRTVDIAVVKRAEFLEMGQKFFKTVTVQADRGNVYSRHGNLLATSVPYFNVHFDPFVSPPSVYYDGLDSLALLLATHVNDDYTVGAWRDSLIRMRDSTGGRANHFYRIQESVSYSELQQMKEFPIFKRGRLGGGLIVTKRAERKRPFGWLARRTVGYSSAAGRKVGLEGAFDEVLAGESGEEEMFRVAEDLWLPTANLSVVEPRSGANVHTTLDVNIQDIAENALMKAVRQHQPDWGTAIVMDVRTGALRAVANLGRAAAGGTTYGEYYNYAIGMSTEPGSTFKLATMMALLEDGYVTPESEIDIERGAKPFYDQEMKDSNPLSTRWNVISVRDAFEQSSNVGMAKLVDSFYRENEFSERLQGFYLDRKTDLELVGEAAPFVNDTSSATFSGISRPWMAIGYETRLTPLQMLTFYNAVANDGRLMKPYLVDNIRKDGRIVQNFKPTVVDPKIASRRTVEQLQLLLEGVVERGTAKRLRTEQYRFAGKTGTSQQGYGRRGRRVQHQASFAGYFPAKNPVYSVIVVMYKPRSGAIYGGDVAGPVFREIADQIYNSMIDVHEPLNRGPRPVLYASQLPNRDAGYLPELVTVLDYVNVRIDSLPPGELATIVAEDEEVGLRTINPAGQAFPNVRGMRLRDAVYVLENAGYVVHPRGVGRVVDMKWQRDGRGQRGRDVDLILR